MGEVVGAVELDREPVPTNHSDRPHPQSRVALVGECLDVTVNINGCAIPFVLDTGSQVTLISQSLFEKYLKGTGVKSASNVPWLTLRAANGLKIPYIGYVMVNCMVGNVKVPEKGIIVVEDDCLGPDKGILGMNVINHVWSVLT